MEGGQRRKAVENMLKAEVETRFDLRNGPLVRGRIIRLATDKHLLLITAHHIVCDGWAIDVLVRDIGAIYNACCRKEELGLPLQSHSGWSPDYGDVPAATAMYISEVDMWAHRPFTALMWSGAFERHPDLKYVLTDGDIALLSAPLSGRAGLGRWEEACLFGSPTWPQYAEERGDGGCGCQRLAPPV